MKKFIALVVSMLAGLSLLSAQNFTATCNGQAITEGGTYTVAGVVDMVEVFQLTANFTVTNTSGSDLSFNMSFEPIGAVPDGGFITMCGFGNCISTATFPNDQTIAAGATEGNDELAPLDIAYMPPFENEDPVSVRVTMMDKTSGKNLTFTVNFVPGDVANESTVKAVVAAYPNPAAGQVNFRMDNVKAGSSIVLRDMNGRAVRSAKVSGNAEVSMSLAGLASGLYFYTVEEQGRKLAAGKLIVR